MSHRRSWPSGGRTLLAVSSLLLACSLLSASIAVEGSSERPVNVELEEVRFDPIGQGKNTVAVRVRNLTDQRQVFGIHIQTNSAIEVGSQIIRPGWGAQFFRSLAPNEDEWHRFSYQFMGTADTESWVRLRFYNPTSVEDWRSEDHFLEVKRSSSELEARKPDEVPIRPAPSRLAEVVLGRFERIQGLLREEKYEDAWETFTTGYREAGFNGRFEGFQASMVGRNPFSSWSRSDFLSLEPVAVALRGELAVLSAQCADAVWTIDLAQEDGRWQVDWISGRSLERVLADALERQRQAVLGLPSETRASPAEKVEPRDAHMKPFWSPADPLSTSYTIEVHIDPTEGAISGTETVRLVNASSTVIEQLALRKGLGKEATFTLEIDGERPLLRPSPEAADADTPIMLALPQPLKSGEELEMEITFGGPLPEPLFGALMLIGPPFQEASWHPRLWWGYPTHDDYEVRISAPEGWGLTASGRAEDPRGPWRATGVRCFGIVLAEDFEVDEAEAGDVRIRCLFRSEERQCAELLLETAVDVVNFYRREFGFYPYSFLSIMPGSESSAGGCPVATGIVAVHGQARFDAKPAEWWQWITAHEIAHQYWGEHVLDAEPVLGPEFGSWLSIGLGIYMDREYAVAARGLGQQHHRGRLEGYCEAVQTGADTTVIRPVEQLREADYDVLNNVIVHDKGFSIVSALESVIAKDALRRIHGRCLEDFRGRRLGTAQFQRVCEEETGQDLDWFFDQWLRTNRYLGYRVASVDTGREGGRHTVTVQIERIGTLTMPIPVEARFEDGSTQRATSDQMLRVSALRFESGAPLKEVVLDPDGALPLLQKPILDIARQIRELSWTGAGESALKAFELARESDLEGADPWGKLGLTLYDGGYYAEALEAFGKTAVSDDPVWRPVALVWQGHILDLLDRREEALARYKEAQTLPFPGAMRHDQYGIVIDEQWIEARLKTPFERVEGE